MLATPCSLLPRGGAAEPSSEKQIERWIEELGSDRFDVREAATRELKERQEAVAALLKALSSPDAEVRGRAARILEALKAKRARRALARAYALGKEGRIVETVDRLVYWREWDKDKEGWDTLTRFADKLMDRAAGDINPPGNPNVWKTPGLPAGDFRRYYEARGSKPSGKPPTEISGRKIMSTYDTPIILARGEQVSIKRDKDNPSIVLSIVAASEDVRLDVSAPYSLIIAGGDIKASSLDGSILVCDGDVELLERPHAGLIIARGKVTCRRKLTGCVVRSENYYQFRDGKRIIIKDGTPDPVGFVKFFEFSDVGLAVSDRDQKEEPIQDGVRLKDVRKDSTFASGLRTGDVVTALDGTKATSPEVFRRLLRRKLGQGGPILTFTVRRGKEILDVDIPIKD
jgi:hypothetical protein